MQDQLPAWVPRPVVDCILRQMDLADEKAETDMLSRLGADPRMKRVWAELYKREGSGPNPRPYFNKALIWQQTRAAAGKNGENNNARVQLALK